MFDLAMGLATRYASGLRIFAGCAIGLAAVYASVRLYDAGYTSGADAANRAALSARLAGLTAERENFVRLQKETQTIGVKLANTRAALQQSRANTAKLERANNAKANCPESGKVGDFVVPADWLDGVFHLDSGNADGTAVTPSAR